MLSSVFSKNYYESEEYSLNTKTFHGHGLNRILAAFLCVLLLVGLLPVSAFAATEGQRASSAYGDTVVGSDGKAYYSPSGYYTMTYHSDGTTSYSYHGGNVAYRHFVLSEGGGAYRWVYCIESGIRFGDSDDGYYSDNTNNSQYFNRLPESARRGIMLTSLYGWQPGQVCRSAESMLMIGIWRHSVSFGNISSS